MFDLFSVSFNTTLQKGNTPHRTSAQCMIRTLRGGHKKPTSRTPSRLSSFVQWKTRLDVFSCLLQVSHTGNMHRNTFLLSQTGSQQRE